MNNSTSTFVRYEKRPNSFLPGLPRSIINQFRFQDVYKRQQLELFSAEHPDVRPETAEFLTLLREQTERLIQLTRTLLEMSNLRQRTV